MKYFYVQNGQIIDGPFNIQPASSPPKYHGIDFGKDPQRLIDLGWLWQEVVGFEPFDSRTQTRTGPVHTILADRVVSTYTITNKTQAQLDAERDLLVNKNMNTAQNKTILSAMWELHQAIRGINPLPNETKPTYINRLKDIWKSLS